MDAQQTPDAVREAAEEIVALPHGLDIGYAQDIARRILAALDSRAGDAGEEVDFSLSHDDDPAFLAAWADMEAKGFAYGNEALESAHLGWLMAKGVLTATTAPAIAAVPAGEVDALRVDWNRRELADAYDMVEGMRQQIAQPAESPLNQSLLTVMDALEAADVEWSGITKTDRSSEA